MSDEFVRRGRSLPNEVGGRWVGGVPARKAKNLRAWRNDNITSEILVNRAGLIRMSTEGTEKAFDDQGQYEEVVEIDEHGNVYRPGEAPRSDSGRKPTILRDPEGEYV